MKWFRRKLFLVLFFGFVSSLVLFVVGTYKGPTPTFFLIPTRSWEMFLGALVAVLHFEGSLEKGRERGLLGIAMWVALVCLVASFFFVSGEAGINVWMIPSTLATALILYNRNEEHPLALGLASPGMVAIGKLSYSLYIWHWPVIVLLRDGSFNFGPGEELILATVLMVAVSLLSYHFIEQPIRLQKRIWPTAAALLAVSVSACCFLVFGQYRTNYDTSRFDTVAYYGQQYDLSPRQPVDKELELKRVGILAPPREKDVGGSYLKGGLIREFGDGKIDVVVLGDSHALMWCKCLEEIAEEDRIDISFLAMTGTSPFFKIPINFEQKGGARYSREEKIDFDEARLNFLRKWKPSVVVITSRWSMRKLADARDLMNFVETLGSKVLILEQPPELSMGNRNTSQFFSFKKLKPNEESQLFYREGNHGSVAAGQQLLHTLSLDYQNVSLFPVYREFGNDSEEVLVGQSKTLYYYDDDHLSYQGTAKLKSGLRDCLHNLLSQEKK